LGAHARGIHRAHRGTSRMAHFNASQLRKVLCSFRLLTVSKDISAIAAAPSNPPPSPSAPPPLQSLPLPAHRLCINSVSRLRSSPPPHHHTPPLPRRSP